MPIRPHVVLLALLLVLLLAAAPPAAFAAAEKAKTTGGSQAEVRQAVFLPFAVKTEPRQDHLRSGLASILATRLSSRIIGLIAIHGADKIGGLEELLHSADRQEARKMLKQMRGDHLLVGSLEQRQEGYEILVHVFGSGKAAPASFSRRIAVLDQAIPALDELAGEIADNVFSLKPSAKEDEAAALAKAGVSGFQTVHPDKAWRTGLPSPPSKLAEAGSAGMTGGDALQTFAVRSSGELDASFLAMDAGDLDGDGQEELLLIEHGRAVIARFGGGGSFQQIAELPLPSYLGLHAVQLADLDGGGKGLEICISASSGSSPSSRLLRWNGGFHVLDEHVPYYLRPDVDSAGRPMLLGQAAGGGIFRLTVSPSGQVAQAEEVGVPQGFGLHDFIRADLDQDGRREFVGLTEDNKLLILNPDGKPLWKSEEAHGAGRDALGTLASRRQARIDHPDEAAPRYLHTRLIAQDLTGDGRPEIIVARNRMTNVNFFKNIRYFNGSSIVALSWDGRQMNQLWETKEIPGYTADYQVLRSAEHPGHFRLYSIESDDNGNPLRLWAKEKSVVKMQELNGMTPPSGSRRQSSGANKDIGAVD